MNITAHVRWSLACTKNTRSKVRISGRFESSPAIHRWEQMRTSIKSVKRTTETSIKEFPSAVRFADYILFAPRPPSSELLGYYQSSAARAN